MTGVNVPPGVKVKGLNLVMGKADGTTTPQQWTAWEWADWIKPQIDLAAALGANTVKTGGSGIVTEGYPIRATFNARMRQLIDYCVSLGLRVYWSFVSSPDTSVANATSDLQNVSAILAEYPTMVIGHDVGNEAGQVVGFVSMATAVALVPIAQAAAPGIPVTISQFANNAAGLTAAGVQTACGAGIDFMDFHPYWTVGSIITTDLAAFRAAAYFKPWLLGECGSPVSAGSSAQTAFWEACGRVAQAADCGGAVGFAVTDYSETASLKYGVYDNDLSTLRTQLSTPFASWLNKPPTVPASARASRAA